MRLLTEIDYEFHSLEYSYRDDTGEIKGRIDINKMLSNGHTARGILVRVFCNWLNFPEKQEWTVEIHDTGALILDNKSKSKKYLFHAVKEKEEIEETINKSLDLKLNIHNHFCAVLDQFETSKTVKFYEVNL